MHCFVYHSSPNYFTRAALKATMNQSRLLFFVSVILLLASSSIAQNSSQNAPPAQVGPAIPDSPARLQAQLEEIVKIKNKKELKRREQLIGELRIPDPDGWFASVFGNDDGSKLATTYKNGWEDFEDEFTKTMADFAQQGRTHISIKEVSLRAKPAVDGQSEPAATEGKTTPVFYSAEAAQGSERGWPLPGVYTYAQGAFRLINWRTLYGLPYVKPMRIRIGGNVAAAKLVQQVAPVYPAEARKNKVSGTVQLHVVLDREGRVIRIDVVSGPPELVDAPVNAVRQWRYQPTLLNGDPVEVDTLISVQFTLK
jgi:TonB family protein